MSWNARALLARRTRSRNKKWSWLLELLKDADVVVVQEIRGNEVLLEALVLALRRLWFVAWDYAPVRREGGLLVLARRVAFPSGAQFCFASHAAGRVARLHCQGCNLAVLDAPL